MIAEPMTEDMRATARMLTQSSTESGSEVRKVLLFPSAHEIRLIYVDTTARPAGEENRVIPFYFGPSPANGINFGSAVALIRPEEEGHLTLPADWGTWQDAEVFWENTGWAETQVQYISDAEGKQVGVIVPIELWHEIASERETAYLLKSENMKRRLLAAKQQDSSENGKTT